MALRLAPVTQEDVPRLVDILWAAMSASAFFRATGDMPNPENKDDTVDASVRREMQIRRYIDNWGQDPTMRLFKVVDSETGEMIAFSRWHLFLSQDDLARWRATRKAGAVMEIPAGANGPAYRYTWEKMYTKAREVFGDDGRPHYRMSSAATYKTQSTLLTGLFFFSAQRSYAAGDRSHASQARSRLAAVEMGLPARR